MTRAQFLREVGDTLDKRQNVYGNPTDNLRAIAKCWSEYKDTHFTYLDVCIMMILTKAMRLRQQPNHEDSYKDIAGYATLAMEFIEKAQNEDHQ